MPREEYQIPILLNNRIQYITSRSPPLLPSPPLPLQQFEKMVKLHKRAMEKLPPVMEAMNTFDVPKTVKDAETLLQRDIDEKETMVNIIAEAEVSVDRFMTELKEQNPETTLQISPPMNLKVHSRFDSLYVMDRKQLCCLTSSLSNEAQITLRCTVPCVTGLHHHDVIAEQHAGGAADEAEGV